MNNKTGKNYLYSQLPFIVENFTIRKRTREDIDLRCEWPSYPPPYKIFNSSLIDKPVEEREIRYIQDMNNPETIILSADDENSFLIGSFTIFDIDWKSMIVNNMGIRLHPDRCGRGIGSLILSGIIQWLFKNKFLKVRLDVSRENTRAVASYKKCDFNIIGEVNVNRNIHWLMECENAAI